MLDSYKIIVFAPNLHAGGGRILLQELYDKCPSSSVKWYLPQGFKADGRNNYYKPGIISRLRAEFDLALSVEPKQFVLFFNGSAPLFKPKCRYAIYIQNTLLFRRALDFNIGVGKLPRIRLWIEKLVLKFRWASVSCIFCQTESIYRLINELTSSESIDSPCVKVLPFVRGSHFEHSYIHNSDSRRKFIYPASVLGYKNHKNLLMAWFKYVEKYPHARLYLTISEKEFDSIIHSLGLTYYNKCSVYLIDKMQHCDLMIKMSLVDALIFPSSTESFGLPLLEATNLGLDILAPEQDYVRDVCLPTETFDSSSEHSILQALYRYSGAVPIRRKVLGAQELWKELISEAKNCEVS